MGHLHWVSAGRIDGGQPAAVVAGVKTSLMQMWAASSRNGRGPHKIPIGQAMAPRAQIS